MSALGIQSDPSASAEATFGTKDPVLAATLGNFGFLAKRSLPMLLVVSSAKVIAHVDRNSGRVDDCAHLEFRFESEIVDPVMGRLKANDISQAHEIAKLAQKEQTREISGAEAMKLEDLRARWKAKRIGVNGVNHAGTLLWVVQKCYDQVTNFMVVCAVTKELAKNPMIEFSKQVFRGTAYAVEPLNAEPTAQRRSEKLFRR